MAHTKTKQELHREIAALRKENEDLQTRLDDILQIAAPEDEEDEEDDDEDSEEDEE